ncbi:hypothetical protein ACIQWA_20090 [Kitasatospora sp. NPDC098652]|uniref:hypothetical protein n=1 Tax=Kitasatospora sp. NPDC098652 TaxID=3364095 RepID=UPI0037F68A76
MRSARTLLAGAAVAAVLTVGTPMAFADGSSSDQGKNLTWQEKQPEKGGSDSSKGYDDKKSGGSSEEHKGSSEHKGSDSKGSDEHKGYEGKGSEGREEEHTPHGGVHTGGGGLALSGGGLASGAVLLLGGLGAGAFALRRGRRTSGAAAV